MIIEYSDGWICYIFYSLQYPKVNYKHVKMSVKNQPNFIGSVHDGINGIKDKCDFFQLKIDYFPLWFLYMLLRQGRKRILATQTQIF